MEAILTKILIHLGTKYWKQISMFILVLFLLFFVGITSVYNKTEGSGKTDLVNEVGKIQHYKGVRATTITKGYLLDINDLEYVYPSIGKVTQKVTNDGYSGHPHLAWDIAKSGNEVPIYAVFDGTVTVSKLNTQHTNYQWRFCGTGGGICYDKIDEFTDIVFGCGNEVQIESSKVETLRFMACHLQTRLVNVGQQVKMGDIIGYMGSTGWATGQHLHFEISYNGSQIDPSILYDKED